MTSPTALATRHALDQLALEFNPASAISQDPLGIVREFEPRHREVVAHIAAPLAYGSVRQLRGAIRAVLDGLGHDVTAAVRAFRPGDFVRLLPDFVYRMTRAEDVDALLAGLGSLLRDAASLREVFVAGDDGGDDIVPGVSRYVRELRAAADSRRRGVRYLLPDPVDGSATKRTFLMLRWLVRDDDGADLGLWNDVGTHRLLLPLDTHTARLAGALGLTERRTVDLRMVREATAALRMCDPADPLRYDMPLCHLGISRACRHRWIPDVCGACGLRSVCRFSLHGGSHHGILAPALPRADDDRS